MARARWNLHEFLAAGSLAPRRANSRELSRDLARIDSSSVESRLAVAISHLICLLIHCCLVIDKSHGSGCETVSWRPRRTNFRAYPRICLAFAYNASRVPQPGTCRRRLKVSPPLF